MNKYKHQLLYSAIFPLAMCVYVFSKLLNEFKTLGTWKIAALITAGTIFLLMAIAPIVTHFYINKRNTQK